MRVLAFLVALALGAPALAQMRSTPNFPVTAPAANDNSGAIATTSFVQATLSGALAGLNKASFGLGNVDNTSDANKPVSTSTQAALNAKASLASPALTGTPTTPTASAGTSTTQIASTAFVTSALSPYLTSAAAGATYASLASPALTGTPTAPTATAGASTTQVATTAFVTAGLATKAAIVAESLGANGYRKWSDGVIEQWGTIAGSSSDQSVTFSTPFTAAPWSVTANVLGNPGTNTLNTVMIDAISASGFTSRPRYATSTTTPTTVGISGAAVNWSAIGK